MTQSPLNAAMLRQRAMSLRDVAEALEFRLAHPLIDPLHAILRINATTLDAEATRLEAMQQGGVDRFPTNYRCTCGRVPSNIQGCPNYRCPHIGGFHKSDNPANRSNGSGKPEPVGDGRASGNAGNQQSAVATQEPDGNTNDTSGPSPTTEAQHPLSDDLTKLGWEMNERRDDEAAQLLFKAAAALNEMTKERDDARKDLASLTDYVEHDNGLKAQLESAKGWEKLNHKRAEAAESQLSLARAVVEAAKDIVGEWDGLGGQWNIPVKIRKLMTTLAAFDDAYPQQDKE